MNISLTNRLNITITIALLLIIVIVSLSIRHQLTPIIDADQREVFSEKIARIYSTIERKDRRLKLTGIVEAYQDDFQQQVLEEFRDLYYTPNTQTVYPFILDTSGKLLLHPVLPYGDTSLKNTEFAKNIIEIQNGDFYYTYSDGVKKWTLFRTYDEWGWIIGYTIPIEEKYANLWEFQIIIVQILIFVSLLVLIVITLLVRKQLQPISTLAAASVEIASGNLEYEITGSGTGEIATMTENFRFMQRSIKKTIKDLAKSEENLRITMNSIGDGVIATNQAGEVAQINSIAENLTGWSCSESIGKKLNIIFEITNPEDNKIIDVVENVMNGKVEEVGEYSILVNRDQEVFKVEYSAAPILNDKSTIVGVVLVFRDVTEEYVLKEQLQHSQKMDAIGQLAGGVAHDFNNMLGGIIGATDLLNETIKDEDNRQLLDIIIHASESAAGLTKKLLYFSRKGKVESTPVSVHSAIKEAKAILQRSIDKKVLIVTELDAEFNSVIGDMSQLQNIFLNLGINAGHAMQEGGTLTFRTAVIDVDSVYCSSVPFDITAGEYIQIEVEDTGSGIALDDINKIFEPFFTTKEVGKGTGLGLAAVYGTVQQHHGAISVYSEVGSGTTFHILLPLDKREYVVTETVEDTFIGEGTILVVDDERIIRTMATRMLEQLGYSVIVAIDGVDGVEKFRENHQKIDMAIIDVIMPKMDGRNCFLELLKIDPNIKAVLSSGFTKDADVESLREKGLCGFIHKPYRMMELSKLVSEVLSNHPL